MSTKECSGYDMAPHIIYLQWTKHPHLPKGGGETTTTKPLFWVTDQFVSSVKLCPFSKHTLGSNEIRFQGWEPEPKQWWFHWGKCHLSRDSQWRQKKEKEKKDGEKKNGIYVLLSYSVPFSRAEAVTSQSPPQHCLLLKRLPQSFTNMCNPDTKPAPPPLRRTIL